MNAITKSLEDIRYNIPLEVLNIAFKAGNRNSWSATPISLEERITASVIRSRVLVDCNLVGGIEKVINLAKAQVTYVYNLDTLYKIPKVLTDNKSITSVLSFIPGTLNADAISSIGYGTTNELVNAGNRIGDAIGANYPQVEANMEIIGDNLVVVKYSVFPSVPGSLRVTVGNDENLENISPRSYINFSKLVTLATKAYIYNKLLIELDRGYLLGGQELTTVTNYVESLSDSNELYLEYLNTVWRKTSVMNDTEVFSRYIRAMTNPAL